MEEPQIISFELSVLPRMANGGQRHWKADWIAKRNLAKQVRFMLIGKIPEDPWTKAKIILTRCSAKEPDYDGLVHGFKPIVDALVTFGVIKDDSSKYLEREYHWEKVPIKSGKIKVSISQVTDQPSLQSD